MKRFTIRRVGLALLATGVVCLSQAAVASASSPALKWRSSSGSFNYGTVNAGQTPSLKFTLENESGPATGALKVTLSGSSAFTITSDTCSATSLGTEKKCTVTVQYTPATSSDSAVLTASSKKVSASATLTGSKAQTLLDVTDPTGDDHGPGTYQYPTSPDFVPGSFDLTRFEVIDDGANVILRTTLRTLVPTFGVIDGAQLLDIYVHNPAATTTSTAAAFPARNYSIAPADAWSERLEVQGFAAPVFVDALGNSLGSPTVSADGSTGQITITVPKTAFGQPGSRWSFTVVLTGEDGFSPDQARAFTATPAPFTFGVCASGGTAPICGVDPATVPKAMDVLTPAGVSQSTELDPTLGPVVLRGVTIP